MILAFFDPQVTSRCFITRFKSIGFSVQANKRKIDFQNGSHLGFPIRKILAIFDLQFTLMHPAVSRIGLGGRRSRPLKQVVDAAQRTLTDHNS